MASIREVAKLAHVAPSTVSRALMVADMYQRKAKQN